MLVALGLLATLVAQIPVISASGPLAPRGTLAQIVPLYVFPLGIAWFALPALFLFDRRSHLPDWAAPAMALSVTATLALWLTPLLFLGRRGQPSRYLDYPEVYATSNFGVTFAVGLFVVTYLAVVITARRAPLGD